MRPSFNLTSEPWIPCILPTGERVELGLRETLERAHQIREILDGSPLVTAALHRLLLAVLHRVFGPPGRREWLALWSGERFNVEKIEGYMGRWGSRFELFDPLHPFYQTNNIANTESHPLARLAHEQASGNNDTLFDHSFKAKATAIAPALTARLLVAMQTFNLCGLAGPKNINFTDSPLARNALILLKGDNLFKSLMLNLLILTNDQPIPNDDRDCPCWELDSKEGSSQRAPHGYLDLLTWQSCLISLLTNDAGYVEQVQIAQGDTISIEACFDPMVALHRRDAKKGFLPLRFHEERAAWRDCHALIARHGELVRRPQTIEQLASLSRLEPGIKETPVRIDILGMSTKPGQNKVIFWRHERLPLPLTYLDNDALVGSLQACLAWAEAVGEALCSALWVLAKSLLAPIEKMDGRAPKKEVIQPLVNSFPSERQFWAALELPFHELFLALPQDPDAAERRWREILTKTARSALALATDALDGSARALKAAVAARSALERALHSESTLPQYKEVTADAEQPVH